MSFKDSDLLNFFRRKVSGMLTQRDIDLSGDVWCYQPTLFYLAYGIKAKTIIEIGVADGSTTMPLLKAAEENGGVVHSIDPSGCEDAKRLVSEANYESLWRFHNVKSDIFFKSFEDKIDFAFIDGDHSFVAVANDVRNCCKRLSKEGVVFVSDFGNYTGNDNQINPDNYISQTSYEEQCSNGIFKGLHLVMEEFPHLQTVLIRDRVNPYVLIGTSYNGGKI